MGTRAWATITAVLLCSGTGCLVPKLAKTTTKPTPNVSTSPLPNPATSPSSTPNPSPSSSPPASESIPFAISQETISFQTLSQTDGVIRNSTAVVTYPTHLLNNGDKRPVITIAPGWGGQGNSTPSQSALARTLAQNGYVAVDVGFHQTNNEPGGVLTEWYSDLSEYTKAALEMVCARALARCTHIVVTGTSFGGIQTHIVMRYLRGAGYDAPSTKNAVGFLAQDAGYALYWDNSGAQTPLYSVAMIENQGDNVFPIDTCEWGNCGVRNRGDSHRTHTNVVSKCPAGGSHGSRGYADWTKWVLSAIKNMLHSQRGAPTFSGYVGPALAVTNECVN